MKKRNKSEEVRKQEIERLNSHRHITRFSKDNQPSPEAKRKGHQKKKALRDMGELLASGKVFDEIEVDGKSMSQLISDMYGVPIEEVSLTVLAGLRQLQKAITDGDTKAFTAFMDRVEGRPKQSIEIETDVVRRVGYGNELESYNDEESEEE